MTELLYGLTLAAALGCGLIAGVFFAFSTFVMGALARRPAPEGIGAMQAINVVVINPWFLGLFFGTAAACLALAAWSLMRWDGASALRLAAGLLYVVGTVGVTMAFNVPRNDALARVDPASEEGARVRRDYLRTWTAWNHVRTGAGLAAAGLLTAAL